MKRRLISLLLAAAIALGLLVLPASAASRTDVYRWLVNFVKQNGDYDKDDKVYYITFYAIQGLEDEFYGIIYNPGNEDLILFSETGANTAELILRPDMSMPYTAYIFNPPNYSAEYALNPQVINLGYDYHYSAFAGDNAYRSSVDIWMERPMWIIIEKTRNLLFLNGSGLTLADMGFTSWTHHGMHEWGEPVCNVWTCGGTAYWETRCLICGELSGWSEHVPHQWGEVRIHEAPTCTEAGVGYRVCERCGEYENGTIHLPALGHAWQVAEVLEPGSAQAHGTAVFACTRCGEETQDVLCGEKIFEDMPAREHWAHFGIDWALEHRITNGVSETSFAPDSACTRAQVVTFLWRAAGSPAPEDAQALAFADVAPGAYYEDAVRWAVAKGITNGTSATAFSPDSRCTRAQIVTFLWRFCGASEPEELRTPFLDVDGGAYYAAAVAWATGCGITNGTSETAFSPNGVCTRAQVVTLLQRQAELAPIPDDLPEEPPAPSE